MADKRLIDANALEEDLKRQYDAVFGNARKKVKPEDYFIERHAAYFANVQKAERDGFFAYLKTRPTVDAVGVVHGRWELKHIGVGHYWECSVCHTNPCIYVTENTKFRPNCGAKMDGE